MIRALIAAVLAFSLTGLALSDPPRKPAECKRTKWRFIDGERVPWDHDTSDHEWDEFDHSVDECVPPPC